jgi:hypothetical protein
MLRRGLQRHLLRHRLQKEVGLQWEGQRRAVHLLIRRPNPGVAFEVHRVVEYLLGLSLLSLALHQGGPMVVAGAGRGVITLAATTRGRLGVLHWWSTTVHRVLDVVVLGILVLIPLVPGWGGAVTAVFVEPTAAALLLLMVRTDYRSHRRTSAAPPAAEGTGVDATARQLGHVAGRLMRGSRAALASRGEKVHDEPADGPPSPPPAEPDDPAGRLGRTAGRLVIAARAAVRRRR